jgi:hypothetical protein
VSRSFRKPEPLAWLGVVFGLVMIQFVMRQCFVFINLLVADDLPAEPSWLVALLLDDTFMPLYFGALVASCAVPIVIFWAIARETVSPIARGMLAFLAGVQLLLLPINYGVLVVDKALPRVATIGAEPLAAGEDAWLVWEGQYGVTFLVRKETTGRHTLVTLPKAEIKRTEIVGFDRILPRLFGNRHGASL